MPIKTPPPPISPSQDLPGRSPATHAAFALFAAVVSTVVAVLILWPWRTPGFVPTERTVFASPAVGSQRHAMPSSAEVELRNRPRGMLRAKMDLDPAESSDPESAALRTIQLSCEVVDEEWRPVLGAELWIEREEWQMAGHTTAEGRFSLRLDPDFVAGRVREHRSIRLGARAAGHGPSLITSWLDPEQPAVRLILRNVGSVLRLEITNQNGEPVSQAEVRLGAPLDPATGRPIDVLFANGLAGTVTPNPLGLTDTWGQLLFEGLEPGERPLSIQAEGYCERSGRVTLVEGEFTERRIRLVPTCSVRGWLTREDGEPVLGARVIAYGEDPLEELSTTCDATGAFLLQNLPAGTVHLAAESRTRGEVTHSTSTELHLTAGELGEWKALLTRVDYLRGRLLDSNGLPLIGWRVELRENEDRETPLRVAETDVDGSYSIPEPLRFSPARLFFFHPLAERGVPTRIVPVDRPSRRDAPQDEELAEDEELSHTIFGQVIDEGSPTPTSIRFLLKRLDDRLSYAVITSADDGSFVSPALPPGEYLAVFPSVGRGWAPDRTFVMTGRGDLNIEILSIPRTGQLELLPSSMSRRSEGINLRITLRRDGITEDYPMQVFGGRAELPLDLELAPGTYSMISRGRTPERGLEFTIESDLTTTVILPGQDEETGQR